MADKPAPRPGFPRLLGELLGAQGVGAALLGGGGYAAGSPAFVGIGAVGFFLGALGWAGWRERYFGGTAAPHRGALTVGSVVTLFAAALALFSSQESEFVQTSGIKSLMKLTFSLPLWVAMGGYATWMGLGMGFAVGERGRPKEGP